jgi:hypothetical protein
VKIAEDLLLDTYARRARLQPVLLTTLPLGLATLAWFPAGANVAGLAWGILVWCGGATLLAQLGRGSGKRREHALFQAWGGTPTTKMLRHATASNKVVLERRHRALEQLLRDIALPTADDEAADPAGADAKYEACVAFLREHTRDRERYPLIFDENCSYGFRRNLWGLKPLGLTFAMISFLAIELLIIWSRETGRTVPSAAFAGGLLAAVFVMGWLFVVTPQWVRVAAEAYAERLLAACDTFVRSA